MQFSDVVLIISTKLLFLTFFLQEYGVEFSTYFNVMWQEPRLHIPKRFLNELDDSSDSMIPVNLELVKELWLPNIFIYNLKTFKVIDLDLTFTNQQTYIFHHCNCILTKFYSKTQTKHDSTHVTNSAPFAFSLGTLIRLGLQT